METTHSESTMYLLNDDVLVKIFSYIDTDHLLMSVSRVCEYWKNIIAQDSRIWKNRWLVWNLARSSSALGPCLKRAPRLDKLKLIWTPRNDGDAISNSDMALRNVLDSLSQIVVLEIDIPVTVDILQSVNPHIHYLHVTNICRQEYKTLIRLKKLETLKFGNAYDFCGYHLRLITEQCGKIKSFHFGDCRSFITPDVIYFLEKKKTQIESLELNGYGLTDEVFALLLQCKRLQKLQIHDARLMSFSMFIDILHCSHIKELSLSRLLHKYEVPVSKLNGKILKLTFEQCCH